MDPITEAVRRFKNRIKEDQKNVVAEQPSKRKYLRKKVVMHFSPNKQMPIPDRREKKPYVPSKTTVQGRMTTKILSLQVGEMFTMKFNVDPSEVSSRLTIFRKRFPDIKITTRRIEDGVIGVWRIS